jgi:hypothetical protein
MTAERHNTLESGAAGGKTSDRILETIDRLPKDSVAVSDVLGLIGREGLLAVCILFTLPFMVPVSIPGMSTAFGFAIFVIGVALLRKKPPVLPGRLGARRLQSEKLATAMRGGVKALVRIERIAKPRLSFLVKGPGASLISGLGLMLGALLLMAPFGFVPFSNTLPGLAVLLLALGILEADGFCVLLGQLVNLLTMLYFAALIAGALAAGKSVFG